MPFDQFGHMNPPEMEQVFSFLREQGVIPEGVRDDQIAMIHIGVAVTGATGERTDEVIEWHQGDHLPHTADDFSDPPYMMTPGEWQEALVGAINRAEDKDDFRFSLMAQLGYDMVHSHNVPSEMALDGCAVFADSLYDQYRTVS